VVLVEGIFLFKREHQELFDLAVWVDCSFPTALARALVRTQEGLSAAETIRAYQTIYFPAQKIHFERDNPRETADLILNNDFPHPVRFVNPCPGESPAQKLLELVRISGLRRLTSRKQLPTVQLRRSSCLESL
jgi:hypothetical protein